MLRFRFVLGQSRVCKAQRQKLSSVATGEETEVANAHEAPGEQMQEEAAQEFIEP